MGLEKLARQRDRRSDHSTLTHYSVEPLESRCLLTTVYAYGWRVPGAGVPHGIGMNGATGESSQPIFYDAWNDDYWGQDTPFGDETMTISLSGLEGHTHLSLAIDMWMTGVQGANLKIKVDGDEVYSWTAPSDWASNELMVPYPFTVPHSGSSAQITFEGTGFNSNTSQYYIDNGETVDMDDGLWTIQNVIAYTLKPTVSISGAGTTTEMGGGPLTFTVARGGGIPNDVDIPVKLNVSGAATATLDYMPLINGTATIKKGKDTAEITVYPRDDGKPEPAEDIVVALEKGSKYNVYTPASVAVGWILDGDGTDDDGGGGGPPSGPPAAGGGSGGADGQPDDTINITGGFGGTSTPKADGEDADDLPDDGGTGDTGGGDGLSTGGWLALNDDFDEGNETSGVPQPDNASFSDPGIAPWDGEVQYFSVGVGSDTYDREGTVTITWDSDKVKVWTNEPVDPSDPSLGYHFVEKTGGTWTINDVKLFNSPWGSTWGIGAWVEGITASSSTNDEVTIAATFTPNSGSAVTDRAEFWVVSADLDIDSNNDGTISIADDLIEQDPTKSGKVIVANNDDDDNDGVLDYVDDGTVTGEYDLIPMNLSVSQVPEGTVKLEILSGAELVRVWLHPQRDGAGPILGESVTETEKTWPVGSQPGTVYIEGLNGSATLADIAFSLTLLPPTTQSTQPSTQPHDQLNGTGVRAAIFAKDANNQDVEVTAKHMADVIVGQKVQPILLVNKPANWQTENIQWTISGDTFAHYTANANLGHVDELGDFQLHSLAPNIYWVDGGDNRKLEVAFRVNGKDYVRSTTVNVKRPTATVDTSTGFVEVNNGRPSQAPAPYDGELAFGGDELNFPAATSGIRFTKHVDVPQGFAGDFFWVQIADVVRRQKRLDGKWYQMTTGGGFGLDFSIPYPPGHVLDATGASDTPGDWLASAQFTDDVRNDDFQMYLMFKPNTPDAMPVPLRVVNWFWTGHARWNGQQWQLVYGNASQSPFDSDTLHHPDWDYRVQDSIAADQWVADS